MISKEGWYIWIDATCIAGPFKTEEEALAFLEPEARKEWTWGLGGHAGFQQFLKMDIEEFSVLYHNKGDLDR